MKNFQFSIFLPAMLRIALQAGNFQKKRGFTLLIAVIFMSVMLSFGLALGSLGYKQQLLASSAIASQYAFYAADAALECALHADQQLNTFAYANYDLNNTPSVMCDGAPSSFPMAAYDSSVWVSKGRISLDTVAGKARCADVTIYKYSAPRPDGLTTYIFSQGYDVSCEVVATPNGARFVSRGLQAHY